MLQMREDWKCDDFRKLLLLALSALALKAFEIMTVTKVVRLRCTDS